MIGATIFVIFGVVVPLMLATRKGPAGKSPVPRADHGPVAYLVAGTLLAILAAVPFSVVCFGYLLPGLKLIPPNGLSTIKIIPPMGGLRGGRGYPGYELRLQDTDTSWELSVGALTFVVLGLYVVFRGLRLFYAHRQA